MKIAPGAQVDWTKVPEEFGGTQTENPLADRAQQFLDERLGSIKQKKRDEEQKVSGRVPMRERAKSTAFDPTEMQDFF